MANYWKIVNRIIAESDIILEVLDARLVNATRNLELEEKVRKQDKQIIYVINKCDLVHKKAMDEVKKSLTPCVFVSSKEHLGTTILRNKILALGKKQKIIVGVVGYPNTGKSSVINALSGKAKARTSSVSGFTKGYQRIRADNRIDFIDTPGVIPWGEDDLFKHVLIGSKNVSDIEDPDLVAMELMRMLPGRLEAYYGVPLCKDPEHALEHIAKKHGKLKKEGIPDIDTMSRIILKDWQQGRIRPAQS